MPLIIRPAFTLGGRVRHCLQPRRVREIVARGLDLSPVSEAILVEESLLGLEGFEME
jgi:carbamoyl-phosphate synthase large subunit